MTYPVKFRRHVLAFREKEGLTFEQTAQRFNVGIASLTRWSKDLEPKVYVRVKRKLCLKKLSEDVERYPDAYQSERAVRLGVCQKSIWQALRQIGVTYKKSLTPSQGGRRQTYSLPEHNIGA